jgi:hypothetical protein
MWQTGCEHNYTLRDLNPDDFSFVGGGTLLGIVRDGRLIPWDWDVEVDLRAEEAVARRPELIEALNGAGFRVVKSDASLLNFKLKCEKYGAVFEVFGWQKIGRHRYRRAFRLPAPLFETTTPLAFNGGRFTTFSDPVAYLAYQYGDWRLPVRTSDKSVYLVPECARPPALSTRIRGWLSARVWRYCLAVRRRVLR